RRVDRRAWLRLSRLAPAGQRALQSSGRRRELPFVVPARGPGWDSLSLFARPIATGARIPVVPADFYLFAQRAGKRSRYAARSAGAGQGAESGGNPVQSRGPDSVPATLLVGGGFGEP